jgi:hypothetical protein
LVRAVFFIITISLFSHVSSSLTNYLNYKN